MYKPTSERRRKADLFFIFLFGQIDHSFKHIILNKMLIILSKSSHLYSLNLYNVWMLTIKVNNKSFNVFQMVINASHLI